MITPMEIQNHKFSARWRGFDGEEVKHFLYAVAEEFEELSEKNHKMGQELGILRERVKDMEGRDKVLKDTLVTAQQIKTDISANAEKEAELIVKEAQLKADSIYEHARGELNKVRAQMADLRRMRNDMLAESEMMVARFNHFVEAERASSEEADKLLNFGNKSARASLPPQAAERRVKTEQRKSIRPVTGLEALSDLTKRKA